MSCVNVSCLYDILYCLYWDTFHHSSPQLRLFKISLFIPGTMKAACDLMKAAKAEILGCVVVIELADLKGKEKLSDPLLSFIK